VLLVLLLLLLLLPRRTALLSLAAANRRLLQVAVLANHQNGRDTHIRQILLFGPCVRQGPMTSVGGGGSLASQLQSCLSGGMR
jgi:hypothetical protein